MAFVASTGPVSADENSGSRAADKDQLKTVELSIHPAKPPYAALKYRLLPHGIETTPGNAATDYFRAILIWANDSRFEAPQAAADGGPKSDLDVWTRLPLDQLAKNEAAQKFFNGTPTERWDLINMAARREQCDWDLPIREMNIATPIPELIKLRDLGRVLAFKARIEMSRGQIEQAIETIKTGMAIGQHASRGPTLINALVGGAITQMMLDQVRELIQQPACPNLYWTLTALPHPIMDTRLGMGVESDFVYLYLPELRNVRTAVHSEAEWDKLLFDMAKKVIDAIPGIAGQSKNLAWYGMGAMFAVNAYPKAKAQLADAGYSAEKINGMCPSQAILTAEVETYERLQSESLKWFYADSPAALNGLVAAEHKLADLGKSKGEIIPLATMMLPALARVKSKELEADRYVAALRLVEAIRLYTAENNGQLPTTLDEIRSVPVPTNPVTGGPFSYELHDGRAVISSPSPPSQPAADGLHWEIQLAAKK